MTYRNMIRYATGAALAGLLIGGTSTVAAGDADAGMKRAEELGCQACHGPDGNGANPRVPQVPRLAGQYADYLVQALEDYKSGKRTNAIMNGFAGTLSSDDRENLAAYYASQNGVKVLGR